MGKKHARKAAEDGAAVGESAREGGAAGWTQGSGEEGRSRFGRGEWVWLCHHHPLGARYERRRQQPGCFGWRIALGLRRQVVQVVMLYRALMRRGLAATGMDDGRPLLG